MPFVLVQLHTHFFETLSEKLDIINSEIIQTRNSTKYLRWFQSLSTYGIAYCEFSQYLQNFIIFLNW